MRTSFRLMEYLSKQLGADYSVNGYSAAKTLTTKARVCMCVCMCVCVRMCVCVLSRSIKCAEKQGRKVPWPESNPEHP